MCQSATATIPSLPLLLYHHWHCYYTITDTAALLVILVSDFQSVYVGELIQIHNGEAKALGDLDGSMALQNGNVVLLTVDR